MVLWALAEGSDWLRAGGWGLGAGAGTAVGCDWAWAGCLGWLGLGWRGVGLGQGFCDWNVIF